MKPIIHHMGAKPEQQVVAETLSTHVTVHWKAAENDLSTVVLEFPYFYDGQAFVTKIEMQYQDGLSLASLIASRIAASLPNNL